MAEHDSKKQRESHHEGKITRLRAARLALIVLASTPFIVPSLVWLNWASITLQDPRISRWTSPDGPGIVSVYWNHSLRPRAGVYVQPKPSKFPLIRFGQFDDDDLRFDATFYWSEDGQVFAALDMPQWWYGAPDDKNGNVVDETIYTHAYDFSSGTSIGYSGTEGGTATHFLARHAKIEALIAEHGGRGASFTVDDIRAKEERLTTMGWWRWERAMTAAFNPFVSKPKS